MIKAEDKKDKELYIKYLTTQKELLIIKRKKQDDTIGTIVYLVFFAMLMYLFALIYYQGQGTPTDFWFNPIP